MNARCMNGTWLAYYGAKTCQVFPVTSERNAQKDAISVAFPRTAEGEKKCQIISAAYELLAALEDLTIKPCTACDSTGKDPLDELSACEVCGGYGELVRGGDPNHIRAAIAKAKGE